MKQSVTTQMERGAFSSDYFQWHSVTVIAEFFRYWWMLVIPVRPAVHQHARKLFMLLPSWVYRWSSKCCSMCWYENIDVMMHMWRIYYCLY